jgi:DNA polymerase-3 subunit delta
MKPNELQGTIKKSGVGPLYLIVGEEDCLRDQALAVIKRAALGDATEPTEFNCDVLYGDESDASDILARAGEAPIFALRRLVLVRAADRLSVRDGDALLPYLNAPCDTTTVVFMAHRLDGRTKFAQVARNRAVIVDCTSLPDSQVPEWIRAEAARLGIRLDEAAVLRLREMAAWGSLSIIQRELEKLAAYVPAERIASVADVEALRGSEAGASVFDLAAAIGSRNRERVLRIATRNVESGEAPLRVLGSLVWQYRQIWKAKELVNRGGESEAARLLRIPPFKVREFIRQFPDAHLQRAFRLFLETDSKLKGGAATAPARILDALLLTLCDVGKDPRAGPRKPSRPHQEGQKTWVNRNIRTIRSGKPMR